MRIALTTPAPCSPVKPSSIVSTLPPFLLPTLRSQLADKMALTGRARPLSELSYSIICAAKPATMGAA